MGWEGQADSFGQVMGEQVRARRAIATDEATLARASVEQGPRTA
jgi:hypothetical protein